MVHKNIFLMLYIIKIRLDVPAIPTGIEAATGPRECEITWNGDSISVSYLQFYSLHSILSKW